VINLWKMLSAYTARQRISLTIHAKSELTVSVADTGNGIPDTIRDHLFERFVTQESDIVDGRQGLGLGLSICKTIVEAHGGTISVSDNVPKGSIFTFTLPMEETDE
jgi:two-component system sensor histidine kinase KdpD